MRVLGIESSTSRSGVALVDGRGLLAERVFEHQQGLLVNLAPAIHGLIAEVDGRPPDGIAVSLGPGSFTGLRIGVATAKALAYAWNLPMAGVDTMDALAWTVWDALDERRGVLALVIRCRRGEVFGAVYEMTGVGPAAIRPVVCMRVEEFMSEVRAGGRVPVIAAGDAVALYRDAIEGSLPGVAFAPEEANAPSPFHVARIGRARLSAGEGDDPVMLAPRYHRRTYVGTD